MVQNPVRGNLFAYCFDQSAIAKKAAIELATRLDQSIDIRSMFTLLLLSGYGKATVGDSVQWALPRTNRFTFFVSGERAKIRILEDAFSRSSSVRQAALYEGENNHSSFRKGRVIDTAHKHGVAGAADYWGSSFLDRARPGVKCESDFTQGTRLISKSTPLSID